MTDDDSEEYEFCPGEPKKKTRDEIREEHEEMLQEIFENNNRAIGIIEMAKHYAPKQEARTCPLCESIITGNERFCPVCGGCINCGV